MKMIIMADADTLDSGPEFELLPGADTEAAVFIALINIAGNIGIDKLDIKLFSGGGTPVAVYYKKSIIELSYLYGLKEYLPLRFVGYSLAPEPFSSVEAADVVEIGVQLIAFVYAAGNISYPNYPEAFVIHGIGLSVIKNI